MLIFGDFFMSSVDLAAFVSILVIIAFFSLRQSRLVKKEISYLLADRKTGFFLRLLQL